MVHIILLIIAIVLSIIAFLMTHIILSDVDATYANFRSGGILMIFCGILFGIMGMMSILQDDYIIRGIIYLVVMIVEIWYGRICVSHGDEWDE